MAKRTRSEGASQLRRILPLVVSVTCLLIAGVTNGFAQGARVHVSERLQCTSCRIQLTREVTLGSDPNSLSPGVWSSVLRNNAGEYYVATLVTDGADHIRHYDATGRFKRAIGRAGQGPGEYRSIVQMVLGRGDSIYVFESTRLSILSPNGAYARSVSPLPFIARQAVVLPSGDMLLSAQRRTRGLAGLPIHRLSASGQHVASFGAQPAVFDPERPSLSTRRVAIAREGTVWLARPDRYLIEQWSPRGTRLLTVTRAPNWFPVREQELYPDKAPTPYIVDLRVGIENYLWVAAVRQDPNWKRHHILRGEGVPYSPTDQDKLYDSVVDVIDPKTGALMASAVLPQRVGGFVDAQRVWVLRETRAGLWVIDIWRFTFNGIGISK